ncbi:MAG: MFS transporter [Betaproteobacteria bacterium]|nr:MFS transporter [Betaproteobacteria bacterium]
MNAPPSLPRTVWILGFVSLLMDISSEMIHSLLPLYLTVGLGASALAVGVIEGVAEATALAVRAFSGTLSDALGHRKWVAAAGYGLGAASKPLFALATGPWLVFGARFADRIGKGIRGAPRDALIADVTPPESRGAAYGLRQSLDTVGAFAGPLLAMALMLAWSNDFRAVFWVAVLPGALSFLLIAFAVREPPHGDGARPKVPFSWRAARGLGGAFWWVAAAGATLTLARFSEAFLLLRAENLGVALAWTPLVLVGMNAVFAAVAYPAGRLADRLGARGLLAMGTAVLVAADLTLAVATGVAALSAGVALWGIHMGLTQGLLSAMVAAAAPPERRGTAFGVFNLGCGIAMLAASVLAGALWHYVGPRATFIAGAALAAAAIAVTRCAAR